MGFHLKIGPVFLKHYSFLFSEYKKLKNYGWRKSSITKIVNLSMILDIHHPKTEILPNNSPKIPKSCLLAGAMLKIPSAWNHLVL